MMKDLTTGSPMRLILSFGLPTLLGMLFQQFYNLMDTMIVGKLLGAGALAAVGSTSSISFLVIGFCMGVCNGFAIPVAQRVGANDPVRMRRYVANAAYLSALFALVLTVATGLLCRAILTVMQTPADIFDGAYIYIFIIFMGIPTTFLYNLLAGIIRSLGDSRAPVYLLALSSVLNIFLDFAFILWFHTGVAGAAIATVVSQGLSAAWVLRFLTGPKTELRLRFRGFRPDWACIRRITALGTSSFVMSFTDSLVQVACNATLRTFGGDLYISVMTVINSVRQIAQTPVMALTDGASPVISYNYGARQVPRVRKAIRFMTQLGFGYTLLIWGLISLFPAGFIRIFNQDPDLLAAAVPSLHIYFFGFVMMAFQFSGQSVFKSLNKAKMAIFFSLLRKAVIVVPLTLLLPHLAGLGVNGVFLAEPISNCIGGLACYLTMRRTVMPELSAMETQPAHNGT